MVIEILTGLLYGAVYLKFGFSLEGLMYAVFAALLIVLTMIDIDHMLLPTRIILFGFIAGIIFRGIQAGGYQSLQFVLYPFLAAGIAYGLFYALFYGAQFLLKKEGLGFGDVRLVGMLALYLSMNLTFLTLFLASVLASFYGIILLVIRKKSEPFPFGPFLNVGAIIALFYGEYILSWYLGLL
jgi:leader peptidase (prepilin peptidase)/N-methyltransferase